MNDSNKAPSLRFGDFEEPWAHENLGDIATILKGKGISKADISAHGSLECIRYGELYTYYGETIKVVKSKTNLKAEACILSQVNDVILPASGETQIDIATASCVLMAGIALGGDLNIIRSPVNGVFLSYYLNSKKKLEIAALAQGNAVVHLYSSQLRTLNLNLPSPEEQQKLAAFLTVVDDKIQQLSKKKALLQKYKKGVMQQIFNQEIRFKDENGRQYSEWEERKLGDVCVVQSGNSPSKYTLGGAGLYPFLKVEDLNNCIKYQVESREYANDSKSSIPKNSIIFPKRGAAILNNKVRICMREVHMDSNLMALIPILPTVNPEYLYYLINVIKLYRIADTSTIPQINNKHIFPYEVQLPSLDEQAKIANFLSSIDDKIKCINKQLELTKQYKKGLLQQMFV